MSLWRRKASELLPEFQGVIASRNVDSPMMLWIELDGEFGRLCEEAQPPIALLARFWQYADWCLNHGADDVATAAAVGFTEHLMDSAERTAILPKIMPRSDFLAIRGLLEYHNPAEDVAELLRTGWR